jgi:hypothetical protein
MARFAVILLVSTMVAQLPAVHPSESDDAKRLVDNAIVAVGGHAKLSGFSKLVWTQTTYVIGDETTYSSKHYFQWPDQFRVEEGSVVEVIKGDKYWVKPAKGGVRERAKEETPWAALRALWICTLMPLAEKEFTFKHIGEKKIGERSAVGVQVLRDGYPTVKLYFDRDNKLLVKSEFRIKETIAPFKEIGVEFYFTDYRVVDGAKFPHKRITKHEGDIWDVVEFSKVKTVRKFDPALFEKPAE